MNDKLKKWNEAYQAADFSDATPASVLIENAYLLPLSGRALDVACGRGGNARFLARLEHHQFNVQAIDFSPMVVKSLNQFAQQNKLDIECIERDIEAEGLIPGEQYDVITVSYYLYRPLFADLFHALKPGGLLFYQTWSQLKVDDSGPSNPAFRLEESELLELCTGLKPVFYRENGCLGNTTKGVRNEAMIIAQKQAD